MLSHLRISSVAWVWKDFCSFLSVNLQISRLVIGSLMTWIRFPFRETGKSLDLGKHGSRPIPSAFCPPPLTGGRPSPARKAVFHVNVQWHWFFKHSTQKLDRQYLSLVSMSQPGVFVSSRAVGKGQLPCKFRDLGAVPCLHFVKAFLSFIHI